MKIGRPQGSRSDPYTMWLCYYLARVFTENEIPLPQHKAKDGAYATVKCSLKMKSRDMVEKHVCKAQALRAKDGGAAYHDWLNRREQMWWLYHVQFFEKRELKPREYHWQRNDKGGHTLTRGDLALTRQEIDAILEEATARNKTRPHDYEEWTRHYDSRPMNARRCYLIFKPDGDGPRAIREVSDETRARMSATHKAKSKGSRDLEILNSSRDGMSRKEMVEKYGLSSARISQIVKAKPLNTSSTPRTPEQDALMKASKEHLESWYLEHPEVPRPGSR